MSVYYLLIIIMSHPYLNRPHEKLKVLRYAGTYDLSCSIRGSFTLLLHEWINLTVVRRRLEQNGNICFSLHLDLILMIRSSCFYWPVGVDVSYPHCKADSIPGQNFWTTSISICSLSRC